MQTELLQRALGNELQSKRVQLVFDQLFCHIDSFQICWCFFFLCSRMPHMLPSSLQSKASRPKYLFELKFKLELEPNRKVMACARLAEKNCVLSFAERKLLFAYGESWLAQCTDLLSDNSCNVSVQGAQDPGSQRKGLDMGC